MSFKFRCKNLTMCYGLGVRTFRFISWQKNKTKQNTLINLHRRVFACSHAVETLETICIIYLDSNKRRHVSVCAAQLLLQGSPSPYRQPSIRKSHKRSKMIETHFYCLYSIITGSKIIAGSPSKKWHLTLKLLSVFYCKFVVKFAGVCQVRVFLLKKLSHFRGND